MSNKLMTLEEYKQHEIERKQTAIAELTPEAKAGLEDLLETTNQQHISNFVEVNDLNVKRMNEFFENYDHKLIKEQVQERIGNLKEVGKGNSRVMALLLSI